MNVYDNVVFIDTSFPVGLLFGISSATSCPEPLLALKNVGSSYELHQVQDGNINFVVALPSVSG
jgi:hypothetical protein